MVECSLRDRADSFFEEFSRERMDSLSNGNGRLTFEVVPRAEGLHVYELKCKGEYRRQGGGGAASNRVRTKTYISLLTVRVNGADSGSGGDQGNSDDTGGDTGADDTSGNGSGDVGDGDPSDSDTGNGAADDSDNTTDSGAGDSGENQGNDSGNSDSNDGSGAGNGDTGNEGANGSDDTNNGSTDNSQDESDGSNDGTASASYIEDFTVAPERVQRNGSIDVSWIASPLSVGEKIYCEVGIRDGDSVGIVAQDTYSTRSGLRRTVDMSPYGAGALQVYLTCGPTTGGNILSEPEKNQTIIRDIFVGSPAGIISFTSDKPRLEKAGKVTLTWKDYGMKAPCKVKMYGLDGRSLFMSRMRSFGFDFNDHAQTFYITQTTQFELTCKPEDESLTAQKKTLLVSVGDFESDEVIAGTEDAAYVQYCPFRVDGNNGIDYIAHFSQRLDRAGQKDIVNINIPAGTYGIWASSSDTFTGRSWQDQANERYFLVFNDKDGKTLTKTPLSEDLNSNTVNGAVTLQIDSMKFSEDISSIAVVHADGENGSFNPGCVLLKRIDRDEALETAVGVDSNNAASRAPVAPRNTDVFAPSCKAPLPQALGANLTQGDFMQPYCEGDTVSVDIGKNGDKYYIWHEAYYTEDGSNFTKKVEVSGQRDATGKWIVGNGRVSIPLNGQRNYVAAYTCLLQGRTWQCGCSDDGICSDPARNRFIWSVSGYQR